MSVLIIIPVSVIEKKLVYSTIFLRRSTCGRKSRPTMSSKIGFIDQAGSIPHQAVKNLVVFEKLQVLTSVATGKVSLISMICFSTDMNILDRIEANHLRVALSVVRIPFKFLKAFYAI